MCFMQGFSILIVVETANILSPVGDATAQSEGWGLGPGAAVRPTVLLAPPWLSLIGTSSVTPNPSACSSIIVIDVMGRACCDIYDHINNALSLNNNTFSVLN